MLVIAHLWSEEMEIPFGLVLDASFGASFGAIVVVDALVFGVLAKLKQKYFVGSCGMLVQKQLSGLPNYVIGQEYSLSIALLCISLI